MPTLRALRAASFRRSQHICEQRSFNCLSLFVSGLMAWRHAEYRPPLRLPVMFWGIEGEAYETIQSARRESWIVIFEGPRLSRGPDPWQVRWRDGDAELLLPRYVPIDPSELPGIRADFAQVRDALARSDALGSYHASLAFGALAARMMVPQRLNQVPSDPVEHLRELLADADVDHESLTAIAQRCGLGLDQLRRRFQQRYGLTPLRYRAEQRIHRATRLLTETGQSVKQVARSAGYGSPAAFSAAYRKITGITPREAMARG